MSNQFVRLTAGLVLAAVALAAQGPPPNPASAVEADAGQRDPVDGQEFHDLANGVAKQFITAWFKEDVETLVELSATPFGREFKGVLRTEKEFRDFFRKVFAKVDYPNAQLKHAESVSWPETRKDIEAVGLIKTAARLERELVLGKDTRVVKFLTKWGEDVNSDRWTEVVLIWVRKVDGKAKVAGFLE